MTRAPRSAVPALTARAVFMTSLLHLGQTQTQTQAEQSLAAPTSTTPYVRPLNADCVARDLGLAGLGGDALYFPSSFVLPVSSADSVGPTVTSAAEGFSVTYYDTYKVVENRVSNVTYVLYECGTDRPEPSEVAAENPVYFQIPLTSVSVSETVPYAYLEALEVVDRVVDVSAYTTSACGQKQVACGEVAPGYVDFVSPGFNETALAAGVAVSDAIILGSGGAVDVELFEEDGAPVLIPALAFDAENDPGLLNRAEWIKYLGAFFNKERLANALYGAIVEEYEAVKEASAAAAAGAETPVVAWVSHFEYAYEPEEPPEEHFDVSFADYKGDLVADVSGRMVADGAAALVAGTPGARLSAFSNETVEFAWDDPEGVNGEKTFGSKEEARAAFEKMLEGVDAIVDETYSADPAAYDFEKEYGFAPPASTYRVDGKLSADNGYDWYESSFVRPDLMLRDFQRIADSVRAGENVVPDGFAFTWLRHLDEKPVVVTADACTRISACGQEAAPICPFVRGCGDGTTALLQEEGTCGEACCYEACDASAPARNAAQMAAPAVILVTLLVVFVEALLQFC